jgi:hypothetical protein
MTTSSPCEFRVQTGEPFGGKFAVRPASLVLNGVTIFSETVYDTDEDGNRTAEQAERNLLRTFASRLRRALEDE